jgi:hypothetical protein
MDDTTARFPFSFRASCGAWRNTRAHTWGIYHRESKGRRRRSGGPTHFRRLNEDGRPAKVLSFHRHSLRKISSPRRPLPHSPLWGFRCEDDTSGTKSDRVHRRAADPQAGPGSTNKELEARRTEDRYLVPAEPEFGRGRGRGRKRRRANQPLLRPQSQDPEDSGAYFLFQPAADSSERRVDPRLSFSRESRARCLPLRLTQMPRLHEPEIGHAPTRVVAGETSLRSATASSPARQSSDGPHGNGNQRRQDAA